MHLRHMVTAGWFGITLPLASISAQDTSSTPTTAPDSAKWSFSFGVDPTHFDLHPAGSGSGADVRMVANLTRSWQSGQSKWARHISLMVGGDAPRTYHPGVFLIDPFGFSQCECSVRYSTTYAGLTAGLSYDLFRVSRFTPYVTGGAGVYYFGERRSPARGFMTTSELAYYRSGFSENDFSLGANAGLGLKMRLGSHQLFIEQMLHDFGIKGQGYRMAITPLNIGFRF